MADASELEMDAVIEACRVLSTNGASAAAEVIARELPFSPSSAAKRRATRLEMLQAFVRDGFVDRYGGTRLIFPPVLRIISIKMPKVFPFHKNWKADACHPVYWSLMPTLDHVVPIARGGDDRPDNWVTTSQLRNSLKAHWLIDELGWSLRPPGDDAWDGMMSWCVEFVASEPDLAREPYISGWVRAARSLRGTSPN